LRYITTYRANRRLRIHSCKLLDNQPCAASTERAGSGDRLRTEWQVLLPVMQLLQAKPVLIDGRQPVSRRQLPD